jgi:GNAT superfamily N-acetyltransferase
MTIRPLKRQNHSPGPSTGTIVPTSYAPTSEELVLSDGTHLQLRPISSEDRERLVALFTRLSPESRRRRFLSPKHQLTSREVTYLTDIDHVCHEAIAAVDQRDGSVVGVARYVAMGDRARVADVAAAVADELQSLGVGTALAERLVERARANGFTVLSATTLRDNGPAGALLRHLGFRPHASNGSEIELELKLEPAIERSHPTCVRRRHTRFGLSSAHPCC